MEEQVLITLKTLLKISDEDTSKDTLLSLYVDEAVNRVLLYIGEDELPQKLVSTTAFIARDLYKNSEDKEVTSISEDGSSISFVKLQDDTILSSYEKTLNSFRKWKW